MNNWRMEQLRTARQEAERNAPPPTDRDTAVDLLIGIVKAIGLECDGTEDDYLRWRLALLASQVLDAVDDLQ